MEIFTAFAIVQALLIVADAKSIPPDNSKQVTCVYLCPRSNANDTVAIEDLDVSLCDNLLVDETCMIEMTNFYYTKRRYPKIPVSSPDKIEKFQKLKEANPDLKLIGEMSFSSITWTYLIWHHPSTSNYTGVDYAVGLLNKLGFDGFDFKFYLNDNMTTSICELKTEFEKQGYMITTTLGASIYIPPEIRATFNYSELATCCDQMNIIMSEFDHNDFQPPSSISLMKSTIDKYIDRGIPPNKMVVYVPAFAIAYRLANPQDTGLGTKIDSKRFTENVRNAEWVTILYRDILKNTKNGSYNWTVVRDEETKEPFAFTNTGLWATFDDRGSVEVKAKYVLERGLKGIGIIPINFDVSEGIEGEGRFMLTRAAHDTLKGVLKTVDKTS